MLQRFLLYLQIDRTVLIWLFLFSYLMVISNRLNAGMLSWYTFTPEGPLAQFFSALLIFTLVRFWLNRQQATPDRKLTKRHYVAIFGIALLCYLSYHNGIGFLIAALFGNIERNFNQDTFIQTNVSHIADMVIYAGLYLAYQHRQQAIRYRQQLAEHQQQLAQLKIQQLKAQLNPHFVFNSLNTLDELIHVDPNLASQYLHDFSELFRLSIHNSEQQWVTLAQELRFAEHYFQLMQFRLGPGYALHIAPMQQTEDCYLPPFTLQLLIENVFMHNVGSLTAPLTIDVHLEQARLWIKNSCQPKLTKTSGHGVGLANLRQQFMFLTGQSIDIEHTADHFTVSLPLLRKTTDV